MKNSNQPVYRAQLDALSVAVFEKRDEEFGSVRLNVSIQKRYFDKTDDSWKSTTCYLSPSQVSASIRLLQAVESHIIDGCQLQEPAA